MDQSKETMEIIITTVTSISVDKEVYRAAERILSQNGMSVNEAVSLFIQEIAKTGRLPFEMEVV